MTNAITANLSNNSSEQNQYTITTQRLVLQPATAQDLPECERLYGNSTVMEHYENGKAKSIKEVASYMDELAFRTFNTGSPFGLYSARLKEQLTFIGQGVFLQDEDPSHPENVEIGYILHPEFQGKKFGTEIGKAMLQYALKLKNQGFLIQNAFATAHPENNASWHILEKLGFTWNGEIVKKFEGQPRKVYTLSLGETPS